MIKSRNLLVFYFSKYQTEFNLHSRISLKNWLYNKSENNLFTCNITMYRDEL